MPQDISVRISADTRDAEKSIGDLEKKVERLSSIKDHSDASGGNISRKDAEELKSVTTEFENIYSNITTTLKRNLDDLQSRIDEFDRALESANAKQDEKMSQSCQAQINYLNTLREQINGTLNTADDLRRRQEGYTSGIGASPIPPFGNNGGSGGFGNNGGGGSVAPPLPVPTNNGNGSNLPVPYNPNGGGGGGGMPPPSQPSGGGMGSWLSAGMAALALRNVYGYAKSGYALMDRDEDLSYRVAQKTGDFGSDFTQARKVIESRGVANGYTASETSQAALIYEGIGGVTDTRKSLKDVEAMQGLSRAYAIDANQVAQVSGNMNRIGATQEGDQRKFAGMIGESIKEQGMQGRESELLEATNSLAQNVANNKLSVSNGDLTNIMGLQNALSELSPQLKGMQGAGQLASLDNNIHNADNNMQIALGRGTAYAGPGGMWQLQKQMEKGISDPENIKQIFTNVEKQSKGNKNIEKMYLKNVTGWKTDLIDKVVDYPELYKKFKNGDFSDEAVKSLQESDGSDMDKKLKDFKDSGVSRRKDYNANRENTKKTAGDIVDGIVTPFQNFYNDTSPTARLGMDLVGGAGGYMLMSQLFKRSGAGVNGVKDLFGKIFKGGTAAEGAEGAGEGRVFSNMAEAEDAMKGASKSASIISKASKFTKAIPVVGAALGGVSEYIDSRAEGDSTSKSVTKGVGSAAGGGLGGLGGAELGALIGSLAGPIGTAVGGVIGGVIGGIGGSSVGSKVAGAGYDAVTGSSSDDTETKRKSDEAAERVKKDVEESKASKNTSTTPSKSDTPSTNKESTTITRKSAVVNNSVHKTSGYQAEGSINDELHGSGESQRFSEPFGKGKPYDGLVAPPHDGFEIHSGKNNKGYTINPTSVGGSSVDVKTLENSKNPDNIVNLRLKQQNEWKDILSKEEEIVKKREELGGGNSDSKGDKTSQKYWNEDGTVKSVTGESKQESWLDKLGSWFSNLFGGDSKGSGTSGRKASDYENIPLSQGSLDGYKTGTSRISSDVMSLKDKVAAEAKKNGISDQVGVMMAQMMQESGGDANALANDPMQSAEGHGMAAGSLHDQNKSIQWGVEEYAKRLKDAKGNVPLALQSYNYGSGFIDYVNKNGGKMTQDLVNRFSDQQAQKNGWKSYGDKNYVQNVLRYYQGDTSTKSFAIGSKSLPEDGLIYAHKGEKVTPAALNPDNPMNVSSQQAMDMLEGSSRSSSSGGGVATINVVVSGGIQGLTAENQNRVTSAITSSISENSKSLVAMLENGVTRHSR